METLFIIRSSSSSIFHRCVNHRLKLNVCVGAAHGSTVTYRTKFIIIVIIKNNNNNSSKDYFFLGTVHDI